MNEILKILSRRNKLKEYYDKIDWREVIRENDNNINNAFNSFYKVLTEVLNYHASLTKITTKERTLHLKPRINKEMKYLLWKKKKLFRNYCAGKDLMQKV